MTELALSLTALLLSVIALLVALGVRRHEHQHRADHPTTGHHEQRNPRSQERT